MAQINLRDFYPYYNTDFFVNVPDKIEAALLDAERQEEAYKRRMYRYHAQYSLDKGDGIEHDILFMALSPCEIYERKITTEQLHAAITALPDKQGKRIYAHYILGMSKVAIARAESVGENSVNESIKRGLRNMETFLKKIL